MSAGCDSKTAVGAAIVAGVFVLINVIGALQKPEPSKQAIVADELRKEKTLTSWTPLADEKVASLAVDVSDPFVRLVSAMSHCRAEKLTEVADALQSRMFTEYFRQTNDAELLDAMDQLRSHDNRHVDVLWASRFILRRLYRKEDTTEHRIVRALFHAYTAQLQLRAHDGAFHGFPSCISTFCIYTLAMTYDAAHQEEMRRRRVSLEFIMAHINAAKREIGRAELCQKLQKKLRWHILGGHLEGLKYDVRDRWRRDVKYGHVTDRVQQMMIQRRTGEAVVLPTTVWTPEMEICSTSDWMGQSWFSAPWSLI